MCIIMQAAKKELLKRKEILEAMRNNPSGYFLLSIKGNKKDWIRTLDKDVALVFIDRQPNDAELLMHFRVPSAGMSGDYRGIHGWDEEGIIFCHNRTIYICLEPMRATRWIGSDSEFFFKKIFIPMYRALGGDGSAYRDGAFCEPLDSMIKAICGDWNKMAFVMPDNKILRYGDWEGDDPNREGCHFSNTSYLHPPRKGFFKWAMNLYDRIRYGKLGG